MFSCNPDIVKKITIIFFICLCGISGISQNVKKVISLAPSLTENIYLLGANDKLVGCTSYCTEAVKDGIQIVGSTVDVNVEKILALQPDVVLTMQLTKSQDISTMEKLGINVVVIPTPKTFDEICQQTIQIGKLIEAESEADSVITTAKKIVDEIKVKSAKQKNTRKIFFQIGANPIFTVLENTFMDDYILITNSKNIAAGLNKGTMTRESVVAKNPDAIIIATMGGFGNEEKKVWEKYSEISAVKNNMVFLIDSETSCSPTPHNFVSALKDIDQFLNQKK